MGIYNNAEKSLGMNKTVTAAAGQTEWMNEASTAGKKEMYFFRFPQGNGFSGWNSVYATSLADAKKEAQKRLGRFASEIDWKSVLVGDAAEKANRDIEKQYQGCFD